MSAGGRKKQRMPYRLLIVGMVSLVVGVVLWYMFLFRDQQAKLRRLAEEIGAREAQVKEWVEATKRLPDSHEQYAELRATHHQLLSRIPESGRVHGLAEEVIALGKGQGCRIAYVGVPFSKLFTGAENGSAIRGVTVVPLRLIVDGEFLAVGRFMESLADLPYFAGYGNLEIDRDDQGNRVEADLSVDIYVREGEIVGRGGA